jgi:hypothetical protein
LHLTSQTGHRAVGYVLAAAWALAGVVVSTASTEAPVLAAVAAGMGAVVVAALRAGRLVGQPHR